MGFFFFFKSQGIFFYTSEKTEIDKILSSLFYCWRKQGLEKSTARPIQKVLHGESVTALRIVEPRTCPDHLPMCLTSAQDITHRHTVSVYGMSE